MRTRRWWIRLCIVLVWALRPGRADAVMVINEILADPPSLTGDANGDGIISSTQDEFIELLNTAADSISLANWSLSDLAQVRHVFSSSSSIPGYSFFVVFGGASPQGFTHVAVASSGGLSLNNTGDTITLRDADGILVDTVADGSEGGRDVSLTRVPDGTGSFVLHSSVNHLAFSPAKTVDGRSTVSVPDDPVVPEPSSFSLLTGGLLGCSFTSLRRRLPT